MSTHTLVTTERQHHLDWLRVLAILNVFLFHCMLFFSEGDWHLKNPVQNGALDILIGFMWMWIMPILFLISGAGSWYALEKTTNNKYLLGRFSRLIVPLFTVGFFLMLPPQFYFDLVTHNGFTGSFFDSLPLFFLNIGIGLDRGPYVILRSFYGHLWFLLFLFIMSLVTLPLLRYLKSEKGIRLIEKIADVCEKPGGIFAFLIPLVIVKMALEGVFTSSDSWADFFFYTAFFLIGFAIPADKRFMGIIRKNTWFSLIVGLIGFGCVGVFKMSMGYGYPDSETFSDWMYFPFQVIVSMTQLGMVLFFLGLGVKYLRSSNGFLIYGNEAALPFYILHQTAILIVGWSIRFWDMPLLPKFLVLVSVSFPLTIAVYEIFIKRFNGIRFLFGMKRKVQEGIPS